MTSIIKFTTFSGHDSTSPPCYFLQVDEFRFLLDCGLDEFFNTSHLDQVKKHLNQIDAVLLSHPDPFHLGSLPLLVGKLGLKCPIYATVPVYKMGQMFMYDWYQSRHNMEDFNLFTLDDVDNCFEKIIQLKYNQPIILRGQMGTGLQLTAFPSGHMIGGTLWKVVKDEQEAVVYGVAFDHKKERHLDGCQFSDLSRPHLLISDSSNADYIQPKRAIRDELLLKTILKTVRRDGNVLISIDTAGRLLEIGYMLDQIWKDQDTGLMAYSLALLNNVAFNVLEFAKSQVEWLSDRICKSFELNRLNPFHLPFVHLCHSLSQLEAVNSPKVVLASWPDLECGFGRELFLQWSSNPNNTIIFTQRTSPGTLAYNLINNPDIKTYKMKVKRKVNLEGKELEEFLKKEKMEEEKERKIRMEQNRRLKTDLDSSSEESDVGEGGEGGQIQLTPLPNQDQFIYDFYNNDKIERGTFFRNSIAYSFMLPFKEDRIKWDEYGSFYKPELFAIGDSLTRGDKIQQREKLYQSFDYKEAPFEYVEVEENFEIKSEIVFIDFEGRSDGEAVRKIISQVKPRNLILVRGKDKAVNKLADFYKQNVGGGGKVLIANQNQVLDISSDTHIYQVKMKDSIVSSLSFIGVKGGMGISWIDASLDMIKRKQDKDTEVKKMETDEEEEDDDQFLPTLVPLPPEKIANHSTLFINKPRLSEFKQIVLSNGIHAEMTGGVLICDNIVAVKKDESGKLELEGMIGDIYYKVRKLLYEQFAIL